MHRVPPAGSALVLLLLLAPAALAQQATVRLPLWQLGDDLLLRDPESGLEWLDLQATWDWPEAGIEPDLEPFLGDGSPWRYPTLAEVCARLEQLGAAPEPCPGDGPPAGLDLDDVDAVIAALGVTFVDFAPPGQTAAIGVFESSPGVPSVVEVSRLLDAGGALVAHVRVEADATPSLEAFGHLLVREATSWPPSPASSREPKRGRVDSSPLGSSPWLGALPYRDVHGEVPGGSLPERGVTFRVWAPTARAVAVLDGDAVGDRAVAGDRGFTAFLGCQDTGTTSSFPSGVFTCPSGFWSADVERARVGSRYLYVLFPDDGGPAVVRRDPRGRLAAGPDHASLASVVVDPFEDLNPEPHRWSDAGFVRPRQRELVLLHVRASQLGDLDALAAALDVVSELGFNAIQLTPLMEHPTYDAPLPNTLFSSWYNPYWIGDPFTVDGSLGGPAAYKRFVDAAHARGIAVHHEVKLNLWPGISRPTLRSFDGWSTDEYRNGIYYWDVPNASQGPWKDLRPNYGSAEVRRYMADNLRMWVEEYHVDGFRFDQGGLSFYQDTASTELLPDGHVAYAWHREIHAELHRDHPRLVSIAETLAPSDFGPDGPGFDARWWTGNLRKVFEFPLSAEELSARFAARLFERFEQATYFPELYPEEALVERIAEGAQGFGADLVVGVDPACDTPPGEPFEPCLEARRRLALAAVLHLTAPGLPIVDLFTLSLLPDKRPVHSVGGQPFPPLDVSDLDPGISQLFRDLVHLRRDVRDLEAGGGLPAGEDLPGVTGGLVGSGFAPSVVGTSGKVLAWHRWHLGGAGDDVMVLTNVGPTARTETFVFPSPGAWRVRLRSDRTRYGTVAPEAEPPFPDAETPEVVHVKAPDASRELTLPPHSAVVLSQDCPDDDGDGICNRKDGCLRRPGRLARDTDGDGLWNACDPDLTNDGMVGIGDFSLLSRVYGTGDDASDFDGDGVVGAGDFALLIELFGRRPGPSGLHCAGAPPSSDDPLCTGP